MNPSKSNGRAVCRSTVAPSEPSSTSAEAVLRTVMLLNSSEAKTLKSKPRPRLAPPELSVPPVVLIASMPLMRTRVNCGPRPRTVMLRPSPASRAIATPGMRCSDSARFESGNLAMSSATDRVDRAGGARLSSSALFRLARKPVTTTSSIVSAPSGESVGAVFCAVAPLAKLQMAVAVSRLLARKISAFLPSDLLDSDISVPPDVRLEQGGRKQ